MSQPKRQRTSPKVTDGGVADLLEANLKDGKTNARKRSLLLPKDPSERVLDDYNDDELERKRRKEEAEQLEKEEAEKNKNTTPKPSPFNLLNNLTPTELEEHYTQCIRMCNQNKVNPKNAFKLQLIDYMKLILVTRNKKTENLSLMSCTLDASAKIYSYRVDKVYSDMVKVMSGKEWAGDDETDATDVDDAGKEGSEEVAHKKKRSNKGEKDNDLDFEKMLWSEARLDKSEADAEGQNFINYGRTPLPSNSEFFLDCPLSGADGLALNCQLFNTSEIVPSNKILKDFVKKYRGSFNSLDPANCIPGYLDMYAENNDVPVPVNKHLVYDKDSHLIPDSIHVEDAVEMDNDDLPMIDYDDYPSDDDGIEPTPLSSQNSIKVGNMSAPKVTSFTVNSMSKLVSARRTEYSFFDNSQLNFMAGPSHWSIKSRKKKAAKAVEVLKSVKKEGKVNFKFKNVNKIGKTFPENGNCKLSSKTTKVWCKTNYSVPSNIYNQQKIVSLLRNKDLIYISNDFKHGLYEGKGKCKDVNNSLSPEEFLINDIDEKNDGNISDDVRDDYDDTHNYICEERLPSPTRDAQENHNNDELELIPAPPKVNKITIKYAKAHKRIDIKNLKATIWDYMKLDKEGPHTESGSACTSRTENVGEKVINISDVYKALPAKLPSEEAAQLSFPIVFMAVLHMANEKTLKLIGNEQYSDIIITQDS